MVVSRHKTLDWQLINEIATPYIYQRNAFRLSGLHITCTLREAKRISRDIEQRKKLGLDAANGSKRIFPLPDQMSGQDLRHIIDQRISHSSNRIIEEIFWFWPLNPDAPAESDEALRLLSENRPDLAVNIWKNFLDGKQSGIALHNLAVINHLHALDIELETLNPHETETFNRSEKLAAFWRFSHKYWNSTCQNDTFWDLLTRHAQNNDSSLDRSLIDNIREVIPIAIAGINIQLAIQFCSAGVLDEIERQASIFSDAEYAEKIKVHAVSDFLKPTIARLHGISEAAQKDIGDSPSKGLQIATETLDQSYCAIEMLCDFDVGSSACDAIAESILNCLIAYGNCEKKWHDVLKLMKRIESIAISSILQDRISKNIEIIEENARWEQYNKELDAVKRICETLDSNYVPVDGKRKGRLRSATERYRKWEELLPPVLTDIVARYGDDAEVSDLASNMAAMCLREISIGIHNDDKNIELALKVIQRAKTLCCDPEMEKMFENDILTLENNRKLKRRSDLQPLFRIAGYIAPMLIIYLISLVISSLDSCSRPSAPASGYTSPPVQYSTAQNPPHENPPLPQNTPQQYDYTPQPVSTQPPVERMRSYPLPASGSGNKYFEGEGVAPLSITVSNNQTNYYIKLVNWYDKKPCVIFFVRGGESTEILVPLGSYELRYATGEEWYGEEHLFGSKTQYGKAETRLDFTSSDGYYNGHTLKLTPQRNGNMHTSHLSAQEF